MSMKNSPASEEGQPWSRNLSVIHTDMYVHSLGVCSPSNTFSIVAEEISDFLQNQEMQIEKSPFQNPILQIAWQE